MKVINKNKNQIVFPKFDLSFLPNEIKEIPNDIAQRLLSNINIEEVVLTKKTNNKKKLKGRQKK